jgi:F-type H+-transporting ATPase subunit a
VTSDTTDPIETLGEVTSSTPGRKRGALSWLLPLIAVVIVLDVLAFIAFPPFDPRDPAGPCSVPVCFVNGNLEFPSPHVVWAPEGVVPSHDLLTFQVTLSSSLLTMFIVTALMIVVTILASRGRAAVPGRVQNFVEWAYESLEGFATGMGGPGARAYLPLFACFFILILAFNWSGLIPPVGRIPELRAPTSDVNVTIGLALVAFFTFHIEGFRKLGARGYVSKFLPVYEFKNGIGAGLIAMFVGITELFLEFIKPVTLSMRLFGNIYGGEVALGVVTALFIAVLPVALYGLEIMLTFVQALIFSTLTLMFTLAAIESHHHEEGELGHEGIEALGDVTHPHTAPAH